MDQVEAWAQVRVGAPTHRRAFAITTGSGPGAGGHGCAVTPPSPTCRAYAHAHTHTSGWVSRNPGGAQRRDRVLVCPHNVPTPSAPPPPLPASASASVASCASTAAACASAMASSSVRWLRWRGTTSVNLRRDVCPPLRAPITVCMDAVCRMCLLSADRGASGAPGRGGRDLTVRDICFRRDTALPAVPRDKARRSEFTSRGRARPRGRHFCSRRRPPRRPC